MVKYQSIEFWEGPQGTKPLDDQINGFFANMQDNEYLFDIKYAVHYDPKDGDRTCSALVIWTIGLTK